jgi:alpha-L-rhamnosidase
MQIAHLICEYRSNHIPYARPAIQSRQKIYWRVRVWDEHDQPGKWSDTAWFEIGLLKPEDWQAYWIGNPLVGGSHTTIPCPYIRREFITHEKVVSARLYITALGIYEASINGQRVSQDIFTPGWTDYPQRVQYQTYDVTGLLTRDPNMIDAILGDGWYCSHADWDALLLCPKRAVHLRHIDVTDDQRWLAPL